MNTRYFPIIIILVLLFTGCYKHDEISSELGEPVLEPKDNPNDPVDHFIYDFYQNYGVFIQYDYDTVDYQWDMKTRNINTYILQEDKEIINEGLEYLGKIFFNQYSDEFKKKNFPLKIFLADSINIVQSGENVLDRISYYGLSNIAVGKIREGVGELDSDSLNILKGNINADFWAGYLYSHDKYNLPYTFFKISEDYYGQNLYLLEENEDVAGPEINMKSYGFWAHYNTPDKDPEDYWFAPDAQMDIWQFINMITSHTKDEMDELMSGYNKIKDKYNYIIDYTKEKYGVDLQEIGNNNNL